MAEPQLVLGAPDHQLYDNYTGLEVPLGSHLHHGGDGGSLGHLAGWNEYVTGIDIWWKLTFPEYPNVEPGKVYVYLFQSDDPAALPPNVGGANWCEHPSWQMLTVLTNVWAESSESVIETRITPTKKYIRGQLLAATGGFDYGVFNYIGIYQIPSEAAYNHLLEGRSKLDKKLARVGRLKTQLQEKVIEGEASEAELAEAYTLYTNFLSDEISQYELFHGI